MLHNMKKNQKYWCHLCGVLSLFLLGGCVYDFVLPNSFLWCFLQSRDLNSKKIKTMKYISSWISLFRIWPKFHQPVVPDTGFKWFSLQAVLKNNIQEPNVLLVSANTTSNNFIRGCTMIGSRDHPRHQRCKKKGSAITLRSDAEENQEHCDARLYEPKHNQQVIYRAQHPPPQWWYQVIAPRVMIGVISSLNTSGLGSNTTVLTRQRQSLLGCSCIESLNLALGKN